MKKLLLLSLLILGTLAVHAQHWQWLNPRPVGNMLFNVLCNGSNTYYVAGYNGTMLKTTDGGNSWQQINLGNYNFYKAYAAGETGMKSLKLYNTQGKELFSRQSAEDHITLHLEIFPGGICYLRVSTGQETETVKVIKL
jgi:hypothetical protein